MSTNFYARIIPTKERKDKIKEAIDSDDFTLIKDLINNTYSRPTCYDFTNNGEIHLGKRSSGWKFLWNTNWYKIRKGHSEQVEKNGVTTYKWIDDGYDIKMYYDLTKQSITNFITRDDILVYDEYDEQQDKKEFLEMAFNWGIDGWDSDSYNEWEMRNNSSYQIYSCRNEYTVFFENEGFKLSQSKSDFYSDGLRFSTSVEFS